MTNACFTLYFILYNKHFSPINQSRTKHLVVKHVVLLQSYIRGKHNFVLGKTHWPCTMTDAVSAVAIHRYGVQYKGSAVALQRGEGVEVENRGHRSKGLCDSLIERFLIGESGQNVRY